MMAPKAGGPAPAPTKPLARIEPPKGLRRWLPGFAVLRSYKPSWFARDIVAGLVLTAVLVPVGMGYAQAAGLPAIYGLYATIVPLIVYAVFGPSRILVLGPDSALAGLIAATILPMAGGDPDRTVALAGMLAICMGVTCVAGGLLRVGFVTDLLSKPIRYGYLNGIALTVLVGQLPKVLGFSVDGDSLLEETRGLIEGVYAGDTNTVAVAIGAVSIVIILGFKRWAPRIPGVLVAVVLATLVTGLLDLATESGISVVGALPPGLPSFDVPSITLDDLPTLIASGVAIALVAAADMSVLSRTFAAKTGQQVDSNQELIALGAANVGTGFFQGFAISSSASRTPVAEDAGAKTQLTGIVGAVGIALLLIFAPNLLQDLPQAALGAVVIAASLGLVEIAGVVRLFHIRRSEFVLSILCFLGVALLGVIQGIFLAIALAVIDFLWNAWRPHDAVLGRVEGLKGYHDITRHPEGELTPGLVLFRWDAPLFFANAEIFHDHVLDAAVNAPTPTELVLIAAEPITDIDTTAADMLAELHEALSKAGIVLAFAELKDPVTDHMKRYGLFDRLGAENFAPTIGQAVGQYREAHNLPDF